LLDLFVGIIGHEIKLMDFTAGDNLDLLNIDPKDAPDRLALFFAKRVDPWHRHLAPAARRTAKIDDPRTRHQKAGVFAISLFRP
jgi:hypothetical protein